MNPIKKILVNSSEVFFLFEAGEPVVGYGELKGKEGEIIGFYVDKNSLQFKTSNTPLSIKQTEDLIRETEIYQLDASFRLEFLE